MVSSKFEEEHYINDLRNKLQDDDDDIGVPRTIIGGIPSRGGILGTNTGILN
jgi:hypothetical protein